MQTELTDMALPPRTADTMSDAISLSSPNGRMSNRAKLAMQEALRVKLFGQEGLQRPILTPQPDKAQKMRWRIRDLRAMAARGMSVRAFTREAEALEAELATMEAA